jgi:hypothetical protein
MVKMQSELATYIPRAVTRTVSGVLARTDKSMTGHPLQLHVSSSILDKNLCAPCTDVFLFDGSLALPRVSALHKWAHLVG